MEFFTNRINNAKVPAKKKKKPLDLDVVDYLKPLAERLDVEVEELALNLHAQEIYVFDDIEEILGVEEIS